MDTPLHAIAVPDADPAALKRPDTAARELLDCIVEALPRRQERYVAAPVATRGAL
jgi:hypothetical protein